MDFVICEAMQLPWVFTLCLASSTSRAGNMVSAFSWENTADCPLSDALGTGSRALIANEQEFGMEPKLLCPENSLLGIREKLP